jgi:hypothetical protein
VRAHVFTTSLSLLLGSLMPTIAQDRGAIEGTVTDATGSVIPAAKIRIVQVGTDASWSLEANDAGRFCAPNLPLGNCTVTVQKEGCSTATSGTIEV